MGYIYRRSARWSRVLDGRRAVYRGRASRRMWTAVRGRALGLYWPNVLVMAMGLGFIVWFSALAIARHEAWLTAAYDLGNADQALWNTAHGRPFAFTNWVGKDNWFPPDDGTRLGMHFEPIYLLLAPLYWLWDDVRALLALQVVAAAVGAVFVYRIADRHLEDRWTAYLLAALYLAHPGLHSMILSDFHAVALATPLLLAAIDALEARRRWLFFACITLAMMTKENIPLVVAGIGWWIWLAGRQPRLGLAVMACAMLWFVAAVFVVIPSFNVLGRSPYLDAYRGLWEGGIGAYVVEKVASTLAGVSVWRYLAAYWGPFAGLPLLSPLAMVPALPELAVNLLSGRPQQMEFGHQYVAALLAIGAVGAVYGLSNLWRLIAWRRPEAVPYIERATRLALAGVWLLGFIWSPWSPFSPEFDWPRRTEHHERLAEIAALIPPSASLCTQNNLNPHFTHRQQIHVVPYSFDCEYVLIDVVTYPHNNYQGAQVSLYDRLMRGDEFGLVAAVDGLALFRRNASPRPLPDEFFTFAWVADFESDVRIAGRFGDRIQFLGYEVEPRERAVPHVSVYFQALEPIDEDLELMFYLIEEPGRLVAATMDAQPTLVWYPTGQWSPGRIVKVRANTLPWELRPGVDYAIAMGWSRSDDPWDVSSRLPYVDQGTDAAPRRFQGDTLIYLASFDSSGRAWIERRDRALPGDAQGVDALIGDDARLSGFALRVPEGRSSVRPGDFVLLRLYWEALRPLDADYSVFVHVLDSAGRLAAQGDGSPLGGSWPTSRWQLGDRVWDYYVVALPPELPEGDYTFLVGLYDPTTGTRLPVRGRNADAAVRAVRLPVTLAVRR
ncbi:MAG: hypothetical protein Kow0047_28910 [Anaerolineae bacterium]